MTNQRDWDIYKQSLTYDFDRQVNRATNLLLFSSTISQQSPGPTKLDYPIALLTDVTRTTSTNFLRARLSHWLSTKTHDVPKGMKTAQHRYKDDQERGVCNATKRIEVGQYTYLDRPTMTTSASMHLATDSYSKLVSAKTGPFCVIEKSSTTMMIHKEVIRNTGSMERATVPPAAKETPKEDDCTQTDVNDVSREETHAWYTPLERRVSLTRHKYTLWTA